MAAQLPFCAAPLGLTLGCPAEHAHGAPYLPSRARLHASQSQSLAGPGQEHQEHRVPSLQALTDMEDYLGQQVAADKAAGAGAGGASRGRGGGGGAKGGGGGGGGGGRRGAQPIKGSLVDLEHSTTKALLARIRFRRLFHQARKALGPAGGGLARCGRRRAVGCWVGCWG